MGIVAAIGLICVLALLLGGRTWGNRKGLGFPAALTLVVLGVGLTALSSAIGAAGVAGLIVALVFAALFIASLRNSN